MRSERNQGQAPQVLLVFPKTGWDYEGVSVHLPLALLFVAAPLVEAGYAVEIVDQRTDPDWDRSIARALSGGRMLVVGISSMTGAQILGGLAAAEVVRRQSPEIPIVWGGVHASLLPHQTLTDDRVDGIVNGDGEEPMLQVVQALERGEIPSGIPGVLWKADGKVEGESVARAYPNIETLPPMPYQLLDVTRYMTSNTLGKKDLIAQTSRGCPHACTFCYDTAFAERTWRAWSAERVVQELKELKERFGVSAVHFQEDNFFVSKERAAEVCHRILAAGIAIEIRTNCRADYIASWEPAFFDLLKRTGFVEIFVGVESGSDRVMQKLVKGVSVEMVREVNRKMKGAGIAPKFSFMAGFPFETREDVKKTLRLMAALCEENPRARTSQLQLFCAYPGTPLYEEFVKLGAKFPEDLEGWGIVNFNRIDYPWLSTKDRRFLESASLFSFFLDGNTIPDYFAKKPHIKYPAMLYSRLLRARTRRGIYQFMPEMAIARWMKNRDFATPHRASRRSASG